MEEVETSPLLPSWRTWTYGAPCASGPAGWDPLVLLMGTSPPLVPCSTRSVPSHFRCCSGPQTDVWYLWDFSLKCEVSLHLVCFSVPDTESLHFQSLQTLLFESFLQLTSSVNSFTALKKFLYAIANVSCTYVIIMFSDGLLVHWNVWTAYCFFLIKL